jgi:uncharacterized cofD-like protein
VSEASHRKFPIKVFDEEGNEVIKEVLYRAVTDERTGMIHWQMEPGQDLSGRKIRINRDLRLVSIGGGTGQPVVLQGLKRYLFPEDRREASDLPARERLTAVVTMTDDGGSSGRLRSEFNALPPGDIRNCLAALSQNEGLMTRLLQYRFDGNSGLSQHSMGNLVLTALSELQQSFVKAVSEIGSILAIQGRILPSTVEHAVLRAELADGSFLEGETRINQTSQRIRRLMISPREVRPVEQVLEALEKADGIIIGPGSLYTSILPNLLIQGVADAIRRSKAKKILVANLMTEPQETTGFSMSDHLRVLEEHLDCRLADWVVINKTPIPSAQLSRYGAEGADRTGYSLEEIRGFGLEPVEAELLGDTEKVRHDPDKLARAILELF